MTRRGNWSMGKSPAYQSARTQAEADAILADFTLPDGWRLIAAPIRTFPTRSEWGLALWHGDQLEMKYAVYDVRGACFSMQAHAERESDRLGLHETLGVSPDAHLADVVVTTDADGWVTAIDEPDKGDWDLEGQPEFDGSFR